MAGNPVLYVDSECVRVLSCDVTRFFCQEFGFMQVPAWAPKVPRRIEFWSEVAAASGVKGEWWSGEEYLGGCLEEVFWRLREGGWKEDEVREMMLMDGCCCNGKIIESTGPHGADEGSLRWRVRVMSMVLLRGGWTKEDVMDSLGLDQDLTELLCDDAD